MKIKEAIEIIEWYRDWRLGKIDDMIYKAKELTQALDMVLNEAKKQK